MSELRDRYVVIRVSANERKRALQEAERQQRTLSDLVRSLLLRHLKRRARARKETAA